MYPAVPNIAGTSMTYANDNHAVRRVQRKYLWRLVVMSVGALARPCLSLCTPLHRAFQYVFSGVQEAWGVQRVVRDVLFHFMIAGSWWSTVVSVSDCASHASGVR